MTVLLSYNMLEFKKVYLAGKVGSVMKKIVAVILTAAIVLAFSRCKFNSGDEGPKTFAIGEIAEFDGVKYTITQVKYSEGSDWDTPSEGKEYIIVSVSIDNASKKELSYDSLNWTMMNSKGEESSYAFTLIDSETSLGSGVLKPGDIKSGTVTFEEAKGDAPLKLRLYEGDGEPMLEFVIK